MNSIDTSPGFSLHIRLGSVPQMSMDRLFKQELDNQDDRFLKSYSRISEDIVRFAGRYKPKEIITLEKDLAELQLDMSKRYLNLFRSHARTCLTQGRTHGKAEILEARPKQQKKLGVILPPDIDISFWLYPEKALNAIQERQLILSGDVTAEIIQKLKEILTEKLYGAEEPKIQESIAEVLHSNVDRGELISITESTYYYNRGRLATYLEDRVEYVQFSAIMDSRTSEQCNSRHGLVMQTGSEELADNIPPLHGRCRSILKPYFGDVRAELLDWSEAKPLPAGWRSAA